MSHGPITARDSFLKNVMELCSLIRKAGAKPLLYATWPYQKGNHRISDLGMTYEEMEGGLYEAYHLAADRNSALIADVGQRFCDLADDENLYADDGKHPNEAGARLAAETIAEVINGDK